MCGTMLGNAHKFSAYGDQHAKDPSVFKRQSGEFTAYKHIETQNKHLHKPAAGFGIPGLNTGSFTMNNNSSGWKQ